MANKVWSIAEQRILFGHSEVSFGSDVTAIIDGMLSGYACQKSYNSTVADSEAAANALSAAP